jgi:aminoglycoside phosphotransferase (APT) family kinase protein
MRSSELLPWEHEQVLKLFGQGYPAPAIEAELRHARSAHSLGVPTPRAERIIEIDHQGRRRRGIVFQRVEGPTLLQLIVSRDAPVARLAQVFFELQRAIHGCPGAALPDVKQALAGKIRRARRVSEEKKKQALEELERLPGGLALCHGDYHPANVIMSAKGPIVVDWLDAGRGDATLDAARTLLLLRHAVPGQVSREIREAFIASYAGCLGQAWAGRMELIERWRLPLAVARLAEPVDESECDSLLDHISTTPAASRS